jgi:hypothetical protein
LRCKGSRFEQTMFLDIEQRVLKCTFEEDVLQLTVTMF